MLCKYTNLKDTAGQNDEGDYENENDKEEYENVVDDENDNKLPRWR